MARFSLFPIPFALAATILFCLTASALSADDGKTTYSSNRSQHTFAGATQVAISQLSVDGDKKTASLLLDKNEITFGPFGDIRTSTVFYRPFEVTLTQLRLEDATGQGRRIFSVEVPKDQGEGLGTNTLRLVVPASAEAKNTIRLILLDPKEKVLQTIELRKPGSS